MTDVKGHLPCRLHRAEVGSNDGRFGKLVTAFNSPDACTGSDIEDSLGIVNRCKEEFVTHADFDHLMRQIQSV